MNNAIFTGRLTKDPVYTPAKDNICSVARFTLAVDDSFNKESEADWIPCVVFGKTADALVQICKKGTWITTHGRIKTGKYKSKTGDTVYTWNHVVDKWEKDKKVDMIKKLDKLIEESRKAGLDTSELELTRRVLMTIEANEKHEMHKTLTNLNQSVPQQPQNNGYQQQMPQNQGYVPQQPQNNGYQQQMPQNQGYAPQQPQNSGYQQPPTPTSNESVPDGFLSDSEGDDFFN